MAASFARKISGIQAKARMRLIGIYRNDDYNGEFDPGSG